jgi:hypothetical protein
VGLRDLRSGEQTIPIQVQASVRRHPPELTVFARRFVARADEPVQAEPARPLGEARGAAFARLSLITGVAKAGRGGRAEYAVPVKSTVYRVTEGLEDTPFIVVAIAVATGS